LSLFKPHEFLATTTKEKRKIKRVRERYVNGFLISHGEIRGDEM